jgi:hypothetical protein
MVAPPLTWIRSADVGAYDAVASTALRVSFARGKCPKRNWVQVAPPAAPTLQRGRSSSSCSARLHDQTPSGPDTPYAKAGATGVTSRKANSDIIPGSRPERCR